MRRSRRQKRDIAALREDLKAFALALARREDLAEDLVQETLARALAAPRLPSDRPALRAWGIKTLRNLHIDQLRKVAVRREYEEEAARFVGATAAPGIGAIDRMLVRQAFEQISSNHREVLCMVDILGMRYAEVAKILDIPAGTVMSRVSRARASLLQELERAKVVTLPRQRKAMQ